jgi:hypothetical protein
LEVNGRSFVYDSEQHSESDPALIDMLGSSSGFGFILIYDDEDRFVEVGPVDQPAAQPGETPSLLAVADARQVAELFRRSLQMALPRPGVALGAKWVSVESIQFPQSGEMEVKLDCQLAGLVEQELRPHAKVEFGGRLKPGDPRGPAAVPGRGVKLAGDATLSGQIFFDLERRVISSSVFLTSLSLLQEGRGVPVRQTVSMKVESIEDTIVRNSR